MGRYNYRNDEFTRTRTGSVEKIKIRKFGNKFGALFMCEPLIDNGILIMQVLDVRAG